MSGRYHSNRRDGGNSIYRIDSPFEVETVTADERDDVTDLQAFAEGLLEVLSGRQNAVRARIPWLEVHGYRVGDCIAEIRGMGLRLMAHAAVSQRRYVDIVGIEYSDRDTSLILDDFRLLDTVGPGGFREA